MVELLIQLGPFVVLILLGLIVGRTVERRHFRRLGEREATLSYMLVTDLRTYPGGADVARPPMMVTGQAVIATDYLKTFLAGLRKILGGELKSYRTLMVRARKEAILRMMEEAQAAGYDAVCNLRLDSADIGGMTGRRGAAMVEAFATGTACCRPREADRGQEATH